MLSRFTSFWTFCMISAQGFGHHILHRNNSLHIKSLIYFKIEYRLFIETLQLDFIKKGTLLSILHAYKISIHLEIIIFVYSCAYNEWLNTPIHASKLTWTDKKWWKLYENGFYLAYKNPCNSLKIITTLATLFEQNSNAHEYEIYFKAKVFHLTSFWMSLCNVLKILE